jgi:L-alanine-DL-glutamate epimerase-like enolase superfamily enzyme
MAADICYLVERHSRFPAALSLTTRDFIPIEGIEVSSYKIPTDFPESDGTLEWDSTTIVLVQAHAAGRTGIGYTYSSDAAAKLIHGKLKKKVEGKNALSVRGPWHEMQVAVRNLGHPGISASAIAAVDTALWDLKARLLGVPLVALLGQVRQGVPIYGSGGFTSYSIKQLQKQLSCWVEEGISRVKMKIGRDAEADIGRVRAARKAIGERPALFVDANGAYSRKQAIRQAEIFAESGVRWFEEPVSSDDLEGLRLVRDRAPAMMEIAAGEYGYTSWYFERMLNAQAIDVLQADCTRCAGFTGFLLADALCQAHHLDLSGHTAPALHTHLCCSGQRIRHLEYFHDHVRIENMFFDGVPQPVNGELRPDLSRPGLGLEFKRADAAKFAA